MHRVNQYVKYWLFQVGRHSLHSPFVFEFYSNLKNKVEIPNQDRIESIRAALTTNQNLIEFNSPGEQSSINTAVERSIANIAKAGITQKKYAELLYKIGLHTGSKSIVELGTSFGVTTMYLASIPQGMVYTIEGCKNTSKIAEDNFKSLGLTNIHQTTGNIEDYLEDLLNSLESIDLVFIDANHTYEATLRYFNLIFRMSQNSTIIVFDDIYWSPEMTKAWNRIKEHQGVSTTMDFYQMGVVSLDPDLPSKDYILEY